MRRPHPLSTAVAVGVVAAAALTACGGGGGGGGGGDESEPLVVIPADTRAVAATGGADLTAEGLGAQGNWLARAVLSTSRDGVFDITSSAREQPTAQRPLLALSGGSLMPAALAKAVLKVSAPRFAGRETAAATSSQTLACENTGGTFTITIDDANADDKVSAGDSIGIAATNCALDAGLPPASGTMQMSINAVELDSQGEPVAIDATITLGDFAISAFGSYNGQLRLWAKPDAAGERSRISYRGTSVTLAGSVVVFDFDVVALAVDNQTRFDLNGGLGLGGQTYAVLAGGLMTAIAPDPPSTGWLRVRDAAGDEVRLTARSASTFDLDFYPSGAATPTNSLPARLWAEVLQQQP